MYNDPGQKFINDYFVERYLREYERIKLSYEQVRERLEPVGYKVCKGRSGISYTGNGRSGIIFATDPDTIDMIVNDAIKYQRSLPIPHEPIILRDSWKDLWNWFKSL